jgi:hypothetical protein
MSIKEKLEGLRVERVQIESQINLLKSQIRGVRHTPDSASVQARLVGLKFNATIVYCLIAKCRNRTHLSPLTSETLRARIDERLSQLS